MELSDLTATAASDETVVPAAFQGKRLRDITIPELIRLSTSDPNAAGTTSGISGFRPPEETVEEEDSFL